MSNNNPVNTNFTATCGGQPKPVDNTSCPVTMTTPLPVEKFDCDSEGYPICTPVEHNGNYYIASVEGAVGDPSLAENSAMWSGAYTGLSPIFMRDFLNCLGCCETIPN